MWSHMCSQPINNKELTSFSLRDFPALFCTVSACLRQHEECLRDVFRLKYIKSFEEKRKRTTKWKNMFCQPQSYATTAPASTGNINSFLFATTFNTIFFRSLRRWWGPTMELEPDKNFPVAAQLSHHQHTWMRSFLNPRQLNSVSMVQMQEEGGGVGAR